MPTDQNNAFGLLLRRQRLAAGLTHEALAERARLSTGAIAALESGRRTRPRPDTVTLLADALGLDAGARTAFIAAATETREASVDAAPTAGGRASILPIPATPLIGREHDTATAAQLLRGGARVLTLLGPGGVGKTRLALAVAMEVRDHYPDGVFFVDLSALRDATLVPSTIAAALGLREAGAQDAQAVLLAHLRDRRTLLALDNLEQVVDAAPAIAEIAGAAPGVTILATSRTALRIRVEHIQRVQPLATPQAGRPLSPLKAIGYPAVKLFVERAQAVVPDFQLHEDNVTAIAGICRAVDGLPLAIELAAPRITLLPPSSLLARLERRLSVLTGGPRDLPARQQTLRAAIDWSYGLLAPGEQLLLRRLAVFRGGCTLDAIGALCRPDGGTDDDSDDLLSALESLLDKSLLRTEAGHDDGATPRFGMLETIREYALEQLEASGEGTEMRRRHAAYYLELAVRAEPELTRPAQAQWLAHLEREHDNMRAALRWTRNTGTPSDGLRLAAALWRFWYVRGHLSEGRAWLETLLAAATDNEAAGTGVRATALTGAGVLANTQGDYARAAELCAESLALFQELGDRRGMARALNILGNVAENQGDYARATALSEQSLELYRALDDRRGIALALNNLGVVALARRDYARAATLFEESLALNRTLEDQRGISAALHNLGDIARDQDDPARAAALYTESLVLYQAVENRAGIAGCLENVAEAAGAQGLPRRAARLYGAAAALRAASGSTTIPFERTRHEQAGAQLRATLGEDDFAAAWAEGQDLTLEEAIDEALAGAEELARLVHTPAV